MPSNDYDVFLCYDHRDGELARRLYNDLREVGLAVWFDREQNPGVIIDKVTRGLRQSRVVLVLIGEGEISPWMLREIQTAIQHNVEIPVIPVVLPCVSRSKLQKLPEYVTGYTELDCNDRPFTGVVQKILASVDSGRPNTQTSKHFQIDFPGLHGNRTISLFTVPNPDPGQLVNLSWETFGEGVNLLMKQILNYGGRFYVDACIGINDAGMILATFLNSSALGNGRLGYVRTTTNPRGRIDDTYSNLPKNLDDEPILLLADFEVKTGSVLRKTVENLRIHYKNPQFYFAVFGALTTREDLAIEDTKELAAFDELEAIGLDRTFIACTMHRPGIEPPLGLR